MDPFDALTLEQLRSRQSAKWHRFGPDVLPLWVAEMDVLPADPVREVLERAVREGDTGYPGPTPYAEALAAFAETRWGWSLDPARAALVAEVMTGVQEAVRLVTSPGSVVVVSSPVYPPFFGYLEDAGREVLEAPLGPGGRPDAVTSASKAWNLAGLKAAVLHAGPVAAADLARLPEVASHGPSHLGVLAHTAALQHGGGWLDDVLAALNERRDLLGTLLAEHLPQVRWTPPRTTFPAWLDCIALRLAGAYADRPAPRGPMDSETGPARAFPDRSRVGLAAGTAFGTGGPDHVRLTMATSTEVLTEAVARMGRVSAG